MRKKDDIRLEELQEEKSLIANGLLEPGQPTRAAHRRYVEKMQAEFTPLERQVIRATVFGGPLRITMQEK